MSACVYCKNIGSWIKKRKIFRNSIRRSRVCKECLKPFQTVEVTLPECFQKEVTGILEMTAELPKTVPDAGPALAVLNRTLTLSMMTGNANGILRRLEAIVDEYPLPVIDPAPETVAARCPVSVGTSASKIAAAGLPLLPEGSRNPDCLEDGWPTVRKDREAMKEVFQAAFPKLALNGSVSVQEIASYLGISRRSVYRRVEWLSDRFVIENGCVYRTDPWDRK